MELCDSEFQMHLLHRVDPDQNMARFYAVDLQPSLFGEFLVVRGWGRIGTRGRCKTEWFETEGTAKRHLESLAAAKRRRGYRTHEL